MMEIMAKKVVVNASDVGQAAYCPHALSLSRSGRPGDDESKSMQRGVDKHEAFQQRLLEGDKRCYVASYAYGEAHPLTEHLRRWRDRYLIGWPGGRGLVRLYYFLSPMLVKTAQRYSWVGVILRVTVAIVARIFGYKP